MVLGYLLDKELDLINKLTPLYNQLCCLSCKISGVLNPHLLVDAYYKIHPYFFDVNSLLSLFVFILLVGFVFLNISEDFMANLLSKKQEQKVINDRLKNSTCQRIKPHKYQQETFNYTANKLKEIYSGEDY